MKVFVLDITARNAVQYNPALCNNIASQLPEGSFVSLISTQNHGSSNNYKFKKLVNLIPPKYRGIENSWKRALRAIEVCINYLIVISYIAIRQPDILHIQWLTLIDICSVERYILALIKLLTPNTKIFLTIHNIYPHNLPQNRRRAYRIKFLSIAKHIDGYLVHLPSAKTEFHNEYCISENKIHVAYHGLYYPEGYLPLYKKDNNKIRIIMYGFQNRYKGADVLVDAIYQLPIKIRERVEAIIVGKSDNNLLKECAPKCKELDITWINKFVDDAKLYNYIGSSDVILLPYRSISQSGVLLLALSFKKTILTSNLPSFIETLEGYESEWFFESENSKSLSHLIERYVEGSIDNEKMQSIIKKLCDKYSWKNTAIATVHAYLKTT